MGMIMIAMLGRNGGSLSLQNMMAAGESVTSETVQQQQQQQHTKEHGDGTTNGEK